MRKHAQSVECGGVLGAEDCERMLDQSKSGSAAFRPLALPRKIPRIGRCLRTSIRPAVDAGPWSPAELSCTEHQLRVELRVVLRRPASWMHFITDSACTSRMHTSCDTARTLGRENIGHRTTTSIHRAASVKHFRSVMHTIQRKLQTPSSIKLE